MLSCLEDRRIKNIIRKLSDDVENKAEELNLQKLLKKNVGLSLQQIFLGREFQVINPELEKGRSLNLVRSSHFVHNPVLNR